MPGQAPATTQAPSQTTSTTPAQTSTAVQHDETTGGAGDASGEDIVCDTGEVEFPHAELAKLDEMINRPRWVVPVLPRGELEVLLDAAVDLCKKGDQDGDISVNGI